MSMIWMLDLVTYKLGHRTFRADGLWCVNNLPRVVA